MQKFCPYCGNKTPENVTCTCPKSIEQAQKKVHSGANQNSNINAGNNPPPPPPPPPMGGNPNPNMNRNPNPNQNPNPNYNPNVGGNQNYNPNRPPNMGGNPNQNYNPNMGGNPNQNSNYNPNMGGNQGGYRQQFQQFQQNEKVAASVTEVKSGLSIIKDMIVHPVETIHMGERLNLVTLLVVGGIQLVALALSWYYAISDVTSLIPGSEEIISGFDIFFNSLILVLPTGIAAAAAAAVLYIFGNKYSTNITYTRVLGLTALTTVFSSIGSLIFNFMLSDAITDPDTIITAFSISAAGGIIFYILLHEVSVYLMKKRTSLSLWAVIVAILAWVIGYRYSMEFALESVLSNITGQDVDFSDILNMANFF